jgi:uracil-DNA glycosylase
MSQRTLTAFFKRPPASPLASPSRKRAVSARALAAAAIGASKRADARPIPPPQATSAAAASATPTAPDRAASEAAAAAATAAARAVVAAADAAGQSPRLADLLIEPYWKDKLGPVIGRATGLQALLEKEWKGPAPVYPPAPLIFRALNTVPLPSVRVVIIGQDPYHGPGQAEGLSFSVPAGQGIPSSLRNIHTELRTDLGHPRPAHGSLAKWAAQGVLLLNATLTVKRGAANSHERAGWAQVTDAAVAAISSRSAPAVFLLWGKFAERKAAGVDRARHAVLAAPHPSGLSASRGFFGCAHFSKANAELVKRGMAPIDWDLSTP